MTKSVRLYLAYVARAQHDTPIICRFYKISRQVKVASTETGIIFGNIVYDVSGVSGDKSCVVLNDIHIDIMDYIVPASCTDTGLFKLLVSRFRILDN